MMNPTPPRFTAQELLEQKRWMTGLARSLVRDPEHADDVVQDTWMALLERPPRRRPACDSWLSRVLRNFAWRHHREQSRRRRREERVARPEAVQSTPDALLLRAELHREIVEAVLRLDEPYRSTVLLRYFEELLPAGIARRQRVSVDTVHSRLRRALAKLRTRLDRIHGEDRKAWSSLLVPLVGRGALGPGTTPASSPGASITFARLFSGGLQMSAKQLGIAVGVSICLLLGVFFLLGGSDQDDDPRAEATRGEVVLESARARPDDSKASTPDDSGGDGGADSTAVRSPAANASITGRVTTPTGEGIAAAELIAVDLEVWNTLSGEGNALEGFKFGDISRELRALFEKYSRLAERAARAHSDGNGVFSFYGLAPAAYRVLARHHGYLPNTDAIALVTAGATERCDVRLTRARSLRGRVLDAEGRQVAGATITARPADERRFRGDAKVRRLLESWRDGRFLVLSSQVQSDAEGAYRLGSLEPRRYDVTVRKPDYADTVVFDVPAGAEHFDLVLTRGLSLRGRAVDPRGDALEGAEVVLRRETRDKLIPPAIGEPVFPRTVVPRDIDVQESGTRSTQSAATGRFVLSGIRPGRYELRLRKGDSPVVSERLRIGEVDLDLGDVVVPPAAFARGRVLSPDGRPVPGASLWIETPPREGTMQWGDIGSLDRLQIPPALARGTTGPDGRFALGPLIEGFHTVRVSSPDYAPGVFPGVAAGGEDVDLVLEEGRRIEGTVKDALDGSAIEGARVVLAEGFSFAPLPGRETSTDESGWFALVAAESGPVRLLVSHSSYPGVKRAQTAKPARGLEILLTPRVRITGRVMDSGGAGVSGARVRAEVHDVPQAALSEGGASRGGFARSAEDGGFVLELPGVLRDPQASLVLLATHPQLGTGRSASIRAPEAGDDWPEIEVRLSPPASLRGRVETPSGTPVSGAMVRVTPKGDDSSGARLAFSAPDGEYRVDRLEPGPAQLEVQAIGFARWVEEIVVGEGESAAVVLQNGVALEGRVIGATGEPVGDAEVFVLETSSEDQKPAAGGYQVYRRKLRQENGVALATARTDKRGVYRLSCLPSDQLTLFARAPGYTASAMAVVEPEQTPPDLVLKPLASLAGIVVDADTARAVAPFRVWVNLAKNKGMIGGQGMLIPREFVSPTGEFFYDAVAPGRYNVVVVAAGYRVWGTEVTLKPGRESRLEVALRRGHEVRGIIVDAQTRAPIPGVTVRTQARSRSSWASAVIADTVDVTGQDGRFVIAGLDEGKYFAFVQHPGYTAADLTKFEVYEYGAELLEIILFAGGQLRGKIDYRKEAASYEQRIVLEEVGEPQGGGAWGRLEADGSYRITSVPGGTYRVWLEQHAFVPEKRNVPPGTAIDPEKDVVKTRADLGEVKIEPGQTVQLEKKIE